MTPRGNGIGGLGRRGRLGLACALAATLLSILPAPVSAQMFSDRPPPVPPASVPDAGGGAMSLAPPSGPASSLPPTLTQPSIVQPSIAASPPVAPRGGRRPSICSSAGEFFHLGGRWPVPFSNFVDSSAT